MHSGHLIRFPATSIPLSENSCIDHIAVQKFPAERLIIWQQATLVLQLEPPVVVVDCSSIRLERHRAVCIPSQKQGPEVWVIFSQLSELVHTLIVAHPAPVPAACFVRGGEDTVILAVQAAQFLLDSELH